ncbi:MAG: uridine diphosphate-N-acetylglucosamine-binding protein YvcK [Tissierellia bacterium]|nr:uridine diphosphate-N-acetylglucosamine-binding protein YvcK [Tissierellia bacterium]
MSKKIVVLGGGTGISNLLRGLKRYTEDLTAIVTMMDDGGGSGMIRKELGLLPPGDIRSCLVALANQSPTMDKVLQYRFTEGGLEGQNFGNLLIVVLNNIYGTFDRAIKEVSNVLNITGRVLPVTLDNVHLVAKFANGDKCIGESRIPITSQRLNTSIVGMDMFPEIPYAFSECISAIEEADIIIIGPGSLYTSIIPNLMVKGISDAISNSKGKVLMVCNCMTQPGETQGFTVTNHIEAIEQHSYTGIIDYCMCNTSKPAKDLLSRYEKDNGASEVLLEPKEQKILEQKGVQFILGDFIEEDSKYIRHDAMKVCEKIFSLFK